MKLSGKTVLVTGGGSGIGLAISLSLISEGAKVIICGRNESKLKKVKEEYPSIEYFSCDVTKNKDIEQLLVSCGSVGGIDILVNNAGIFQPIDYVKGDTSIDDQLNEVDIDLNGPIRTTHYFLPMLQQKKEAAIVNVSSGLAFVPLALAPVYCATKAGLHSYTRSLRWQLHKQTNVKVFELMPPLVDTEMVEIFKGQKMMDTKVLAEAFIKGLKNDTLEITPGQSSQLKMMSRMAPKFIHKMVNKQF